MCFRNVLEMSIDRYLITRMGHRHLRVDGVAS
jgi:hypothetical protein